MKRVLFLGGFAGTVALAVFMTHSMQSYLKRPTPAQWKHVDQFVSKWKAGGDALAFFPPWLAGYAMDNKRFRGLTGASPEEIFGAGPKTFKRVWILSCFEKFDADDLPAGRYDPIEDKTIDGVGVRLYQVSGTRVSWKMSDALPQTQVALRTGKKTTWLKSRDGVFSFAKKEKISSGASSFRKLRRVGVHVPLRAGREVVFDLNQIPAGNLVLCGGVTDAGLFSMDFAPVQATVWRDGAIAASARFEGKSGWWCHNLGETAGGPTQIILASEVKKNRGFFVNAYVI